MEKMITVGGKEIKLKSNGASPLLYKKLFGKDFFAEISKMNIKGNDLSNIDLEVFYNMVFLFARTADKNIPATALEWLETFEEFPIMDIIPEVMDMVTRLLETKKK